VEFGALDLAFKNQSIGRNPLMQRVFCYSASLVLGFLVFVILTSGAFVIDHGYYEWLSGHKSQHFQILNLCLLAAGLLTWVSFRIFPEASSKILILRLMTDFALAPSVVSVSVLFSLFFLIQFLTLTAMHAGLQTSLWDFGFNDAIIWSTAHGKFLLLSVRGGQNALGEHFTPIFILLAPIYWISNSAAALFAVQTFCIALCIPLTYAIARKFDLKHIPALALCTVVFFYEPLRNGILHSFQAQTFADPFLLLGFYLVLCRRNLAGLLCFSVALMAKENIVIETGGIALFLLFQKRSVGWAIGILAAAFFALNTFIIEPYYTFETNWYKWGYFSHITHPTADGWAVWSKSFFSIQTLKYLISIFAPFLFLPFSAAGSLLIWGPALGMRLLSPFEGFRIITAHYTAGLNALIFIGAAYGLSKLNKAVLPKVCAGLLFSAVLFAGIPQLFRLEGNLWEASGPDNQRIVKMLRQIPEKYSVVATETLLAQMTHRYYIFSFTSVLPGSPLEKTAQNADLLVVDRGRIYEGEAKSLEEYIRRGYQKTYEYSFMSLWSRPDLSKSIEIQQLLRDWKEIETRKDIPYRKIIRHFYKIFISILGIVYVLAAAFILRKKENSKLEQALGRES
jgi:uncharacterized membrane protein